MKRELREALKLEKEKGYTDTDYTTNATNKYKNLSKNLLLVLGVILSIAAGGILSKKFLDKK